MVGWVAGWLVLVKFKDRLSRSKLFLTRMIFLKKSTRTQVGAKSEAKVDRGSV